MDIHIYLIHYFIPDKIRLCPFRNFLPEFLLLCNTKVKQRKVACVFSHISYVKSEPATNASYSPLSTPLKVSVLSKNFQKPFHKYLI